MIATNPIGLVCPHCGMLFFTTADAILYSCPYCHRRWKAVLSEMLEANLGES